MNEIIKNFEERETLDFGFPTSVENIIKVIGVGGGGSNAVENMYRIESLPVFKIEKILKSVRFPFSLLIYVRLLLLLGKSPETEEN